MRFVHTNLIARDWRRLAAFYERALGCVRLAPERDLSGDWLARGTGVPGAAIRGVHLRLPGVGADGPTLELFEYANGDAGAEPAPNRAGWGHIAFEVDDVAAAVAVVVREGGRAIGEVVTRRIPDAGELTFAYVRDPEGNPIELQSWRR